MLFIPSCVQLKAAYSMMSQAMIKLRGDYGGTIKNLCENYDNNCLMNLFKPYLSTVKSCVEGTSNGNCRVQPAFMDGTTWGANLPTLVLNNGMIVEFRYLNKAYDYTDGNTSNAKCGWFTVDINGLKGPNRYGKDVFWFSLQENAIKPGGSQGDVGNALTCTGVETGGSSGWGCTAKYIKS